MSNSDTSGITAETILAAVSYHLLSQQGRSITSIGECRYRMASGYRCAVGALIPDEFYQEEYENLPVAAVKLGPMLASLGLIPYVELLAELQCLHDTSEVAEWPDKLQNLCTKYGVTSFVVGEYQ